MPGVTSHDSRVRAGDVDNERTVEEAGRRRRKEKELAEAVAGIRASRQEKKHEGTIPINPSVSQKETMFPLLMPVAQCAVTVITPVITPDC